MERLWLGLQGTPRYVVWSANSSRSLAAETPTIIDEKDGSVSERVSSFVVEFVEILLRVAKHGDR